MNTKLVSNYIIEIFKNKNIEQYLFLRDIINKSQVFNVYN